MKLIRAKATGVLIGLCGVALIGVGSGANGKALDAAKLAEASGGCDHVNNPNPDHITPNRSVRSYLDDLAVPVGGCTYNTFSIKGAWDTMDPGVGTGMTLFFHGDGGGFPVSIPFAIASVTSISEVATGNTYIGGRPESDVTVTFEDISAPEGTVWINVRVDGPEQFHHALGCTGGVSGEYAWVFTDFFLVPAPIGFIAVDFCDGMSDLSWTIGFTP